MEPNGNPTWLKSEAGQHLQESLSNERVLQGIDHLLNRIDTLEQAVENLTTIINQGPGMVSMATDIVDESVRKAAEKGIDIEERLGNALKIADKLTSPQMLERLDQLFDLADKAPGLLSMGMDLVDEGVRRSAERGVHLEERLATALTLAEKLTDPTMVTKLDGILKLAEQGPGLIAIAMDTVDEEMKKLHADNADLGELIELAIELTIATKKAKNMSPNPVRGIFSMMRVMRDPDRQKAIGRVMNIAKAWGERID